MSLWRWQESSKVRTVYLKYCIEVSITGRTGTSLFPLTFILQFNLLLVFMYEKGPDCISVLRDHL